MSRLLQGTNDATAVDVDALLLSVRILLHFDDADFDGGKTVAFGIRCGETEM